MEELARSVPLPPLILNCRTFGEEGAEPEASEQAGNRRALGPPSEDGSEEEMEALLGQTPDWGGGATTASVHTVPEAARSQEADVCLGGLAPGSQTSMCYESNI